ncbi:sortase-associated OmpA-like protein PdsO [Shewanella cyperi]|uniref:sortase-associated OmpA-like protein PdsO n=1 Tax=Shewanella cyperi TaxID=2814292 RepID=UPI001A945EDC|nr:sortase-associated OmpA-like protein PdsO [Shewanella cyperi]QSX42242.1 sortase-associated OmpA-like protein PdsO [Shewanella cyperi]
MKHTIIAGIVSLTLFGHSALAAETSTEATTPREHKEELIGLGSGILLGAAVGGPVGAIIGAFTGGIIGKSVADEDQLKAQEARLARQEEDLTSLRRTKESLENLSGEYARVQRQLNELKQSRESRLQELSLGLNVQFKTGSSAIEPHFKAQLDDVAFAMTQDPELRLDLKAFADRRGDADYNQALSEQRLAEVRSYLVSKGVAEDRLQGKALGASAPLAQASGLEEDFFDRRVSLRLSSQELQSQTEEALASNGQ